MSNAAAAVCDSPTSTSSASSQSSVSITRTYLTGGMGSEPSVVTHSCDMTVRSVARCAGSFVNKRFNRFRRCGSRDLRARYRRAHTHTRTHRGVQGCTEGKGGGGSERWELRLLPRHHHSQLRLVPCHERRVPHHKRVQRGAQRVHVRGEPVVQLARFVID